MSLSIAYENINDAQMRLQQTIVLYDGEPVWIAEIDQPEPGDPKDDIFRVYAYPLPFRAEPKAGMRKFISSKKFDMAPFPMGFMNFQGNAYYCSRLPRRQQRQGLSNGTFSCVPVSKEGVLPKLQLGNMVAEQEFLDCIKGKYPSFDEARSIIERGDAGGVAFSRSFAIIHDEDLPELMYLYHKKEKVGFIMNDDLKLAKAGKCLVEALREEGVRC